MKNLKEYIITFVALVLFNSCSLESNIPYVNQPNIEENTNISLQVNEEKVEDIDKYIEDVEPLIMNQYNNVQLFGFGLAIEENIYFADSVGIHKTDKRFENIQTLVLNENYEEDLKSNRLMFSGLQYYNDRIYFIDRRDFSICSMNIDGSELKKHLDVTEVAEIKYVDGFGETPVGFISSFIVVNEGIYFLYALEGGRFHYFNMETGDIVDLNVSSASILTMSPDGNAIQFTYDLSVLTNLVLEDHSIEIIQPTNIDALIEDRYINHLWYTTNTNGKIAFASHFVHFEGGIDGRIFIIDEDGYANEIYHENERAIDPTAINSIGDWIYFATSNHPNDRGINLHRIKNDGSKLELVYENILTSDPPNNFQHFSFINIISEDIILIKRHPTMHDIYAIVRDASTDEFELLHINPYTKFEF